MKTRVFAFLSFLLVPFTSAFLSPVQLIQSIQIPQETSYEIVKQLSHSLSSFDHIGSLVLTKNAEFVEFILEKDNLPIDLKKKIVLNCIEIAQNGDKMGSKILELYYNCVNNLL
tara:strand:+ start:2248 stop:2589 length:342 start_codon:yes stop_codon:yes gene_type:complete